MTDAKRWSSKQQGRWSLSNRAEVESRLSGNWSVCKMFVQSKATAALPFLPNGGPTRSKQI